jgi:site-specific recombinase XerD
MDYISAFKSYLVSECGLSKGTVGGYVYDVQEFMKFLLANGLDYSGRSVDLFLNSLKLKSSTLNRKRMSIRALYRYMVSINKIQANELLMIDPIKTDWQQMPALTYDQYKKIIQIANERDAAIMVTLCVSGMRVSELCQMNVGDVRESVDTIRIMGKGKVERLVIISTECRKIIIDYVNGWRSRFAVPDNNAMFIKQDGSRLTRRAVSDMICRLANKAGVQHSTSHTMRRTYATMAMNNGVDIKDVQMLLGHKSISATQRYLGLSRDRLMSVYRRFHPSCCEVS